MIHYIVVLTLLLSSFLGSGSVNDCYPNEYCFVQWEFASDAYCDGGWYGLEFCYLPSDPGNREFHHYHATCDSSISSSIIYRTMLPLVLK